MWKVILTGMLLMLCSCGESDPNYETLKELKELDGEARLRKFETFPLEERFRLYNKIYKKSGHPRDAELSLGFNDKPSEALDYIVNDLQSSKPKDFLRYMTIIYDLGMTKNVDICKPQYIGELKKIISGYKLSDAKLNALKELRFKGCELP